MHAFELNCECTLIILPQYHSLGSLKLMFAKLLFTCERRGLFCCLVYYNHDLWCLV